MLFGHNELFSVFLLLPFIPACCNITSILIAPRMVAAVVEGCGKGNNNLDTHGSDTTKHKGTYC